MRNEFGHLPLVHQIEEDENQLHDFTLLAIPLFLQHIQGIQATIVSYALSGVGMGKGVCEAVIRGQLAKGTKGDNLEVSFIPMTLGRGTRSVCNTDA